MVGSYPKLFDQAEGKSLRLFRHHKQGIHDGFANLC
jgi:hypothetical protein